VYTNKMLIRRGLLQKRTDISAIDQRGLWWNLGASHMNKVVRKNDLEQGGLLSLSALNYFLLTNAVIQERY
ncbi:hypothetical protein AU254_18475, partial [Yersinia pestis]